MTEANETSRAIGRLEGKIESLERLITEHVVNRLVAHIEDDDRVEARLRKVESEQSRHRGYRYAAAKWGAAIGAFTSLVISSAVAYFAHGAR